MLTNKSACEPAFFCRVGNVHRRINIFSMGLLSVAYTLPPSTPGRLESCDRLVFQHFPKTAGTTVHHCLAALFDPDEICPERFEQFAFWPPDLLRSFRFFSAHTSMRDIRYIPPPIKVVSFFRHPIERCISYTITGGRSH